MSKPSKRQRYYTLADEVLAGPARQGDTDAQRVLNDRRAVQRMCTKTAKGSSSRDYRCYLSEDVRLHFRKDRHGGGYVLMFLELREHTSLEAIKKQWKEIRIWRDLLRGWQGPSPFDTNGFFDRLHQNHRQGQSYASIAAQLNGSMASNLEAYMKENRAIQQAIKNGTIKTSQDLIQWQQMTGNDAWGLDDVQAMLQELGFADEVINEWCLTALENLVAGRDAFPHGGSYTRDWVISRLRTWRAKNRRWLGLPQ